MLHADIAGLNLQRRVQYFFMLTVKTLTRLGSNAQTDPSLPRAVFDGFVRFVYIFALWIIFKILERENRLLYHKLEGKERKTRKYNKNTP